jgi:threonine/homoserine/homoserine lactone efflux protein
MHRFLYDAEQDSFRKRVFMWAYLITGITYGFAAAVSPGPLSMFLMSQAVARGWKKTLPAAFSPLLTDGPVAILVVTVLSRIPPALILYLRVLGGGLILYLALGAWRTWRSFKAEDPAANQAAGNSLLKAVLINWLNPNLYIGWSVIMGPIVLSGWRRSPSGGAAVVFGFYVTIVSVMIGMIFLFAAAKNLGPSVQKNLIGLSSIALAGLGIYQLWLGSSTLLAAALQK